MLSSPFVCARVVLVLPHIGASQADQTSAVSVRETEAVLAKKLFPVINRYKRTKLRKDM